MLTNALIISVRGTLMYRVTNICSNDMILGHWSIYLSYNCVCIAGQIEELRGLHKPFGLFAPVPVSWRELNMVAFVRWTPGQCFWTLWPNDNASVPTHKHTGTHSHTLLFSRSRNLIHFLHKPTHTNKQVDYRSKTDHPPFLPSLYIGGR